MSIKVCGDNLLVEIKKAQFTTAESEDNPINPNAGSGTVVGIPEYEDILYFGSFNWAFDDSLLNQDMAKELVAKMKAFMGKKIYWEGRADTGMCVEDTSERKLVIIKLSKIVGVDK